VPLPPVSGSQHVITAGPYQAAIASVGATLRQLTFEGRDLIVPFADHQIRPNYRGAVLAPWPNRVIDGRYTVDGEVRQLPLTEPNRGHALHGLVAWTNFEVSTAGPDHVGLRTVVEARTGYPHRLALEVTYQADAVQGLRWSVSVTNLSAQAAPYGTGPHPYLVAGPGRLDECWFELPASDYMTVEGERLLPGKLESVEGTAFDFRQSRRLGPVMIDHAFVGLDFSGASSGSPRPGTVRASLRHPSGSGVAITWDKACPWVQVHTADLPVAQASRLGLAVEPMTCPPDAFNSGTDLIWLEPGGRHRAEWVLTGW
jgi:aldose 1-epimerase